MFDMRPDRDGVLSDQARTYLALAREGAARNFPRQLKGHLGRIKAEFLARFPLEPGSAEADLLDALGEVKPVSIEQEIDLAVAWLVDRDETARRALIMSHFPRMLRVLMRSRSAGDDWLDILHDAMVDALSAVDRLEVYDYETFGTQLSLQVLHRRTRHALRTRRPITGPATFQARRAAARILAHDQDAIRAGILDGTDIDRSCRHSPAPASEVEEIQAFLFTEDTDELPDMPHDGGLAAVEAGIDAARIADIVEEILDPRACDILRRRWLTADPEDAETIAIDHSICAERVRQLERLALEDLRAHLEGRKTSRQIWEERQALKSERQRQRLLSRRMPHVRVAGGVDLSQARPHMKAMLGEIAHEVISRRYFGVEKRVAPYAEVARDMALSAAQVRAIHTGALNLMRDRFPG